MQKSENAAEFPQIRNQTQPGNPRSGEPVGREKFESCRYNQVPRSSNVTQKEWSRFVIVGHGRVA